VKYVGKARGNIAAHINSDFGGKFLRNALASIVAGAARQRAESDTGFLILPTGEVRFIFSDLIVIEAIESQCWEISASDTPATRRTKMHRMHKFLNDYQQLFLLFSGAALLVYLQSHGTDSLVTQRKTKKQTRELIQRAAKSK
jgi:hypothetical protein